MVKKFIPLENGVPSHDTFERVFEILDSKTFNESFINWTNKPTSNSKVRIIAIDGKTSRRSHDGETGAIHIVNAWIDENNIILDQLKTAKKSNEITAILELLEMNFIKDAIIIIDAMLCKALHKLWVRKKR